MAEEKRGRRQRHRPMQAQMADSGKIDERSRQKPLPSAQLVAVQWAMSHSVTDTGPSYSWMQLHWQSPVIGAALVLSYVAFSALLQYRYYYFKRHSPETWKVASYSNKSLQHSSSWWLPILSFWSTKERMPYHWFFATTNMCISGVFQCFLCEVRFNTFVFSPDGSLILTFIDGRPY